MSETADASMLPTLTYLTDVHFEPGAARRLPELLRAHGIHRPLVVTDRGLVELGVPRRLGMHDAQFFDDVDANPTEENAIAGVERFRAHGCDGIIALGGGSPIDCAKAISILATHPEPLEDYAFLRGGLGRITARKPPLIAVPTTAGTGSEVGRGALITFRSGRKLALISPKLIPTAAVCDPELTLGLPPALTAATGMDAISHCVETFLSPKWNPVAEAIALDGLARACRSLQCAVESGTSLEARSEMLLGALEGGLTFQKGLGAVHSLSHALGSLRHRRLHHGTLNSILLPHVLRFNEPACGAKLERLAAAAGAANGENLATHLERLAATIGMPARLRDLGVPWDEVEALCPAAHADHSTATNPRPLGVEDCRELFRTAY